MASYKIPNTPARGASPHELADYLELLCIVNDGEYSINDAQPQIDIISDEDDQEGIMNEDDQIHDELQFALEEIDRRNDACGGHYPFLADRNSIHYLPGESANEQKLAIVYIYLLLATRLNMIQHKLCGEIDGTLLFEELSAVAVKKYFGNNAESFVFGTGAQGGFRDKINQLIENLKEGVEAKDPEDTTHDEKDGGLDVVVWKDFADHNKGKIIGFGQCKTGTEWRKQVGSLHPDDFCKTYFKEQPISTPVNLFFVAESFKENSEAIYRKAGIMFERCRIMENISEISDDLLSRIKIWVDNKLPIVRDAYTIV